MVDFKKRTGGWSGAHGGKKFGKKKSDITRVGNMFKSDADHLHENAAFSYGTTCSEKYLEAVVEALGKIQSEGGAARFMVTKWKDQEHPVLSIMPAKGKGQGSKRIGKEDTGFHEAEETPEDSGL